jgi:two-component system response regulator AlgR
VLIVDDEPLARDRLGRLLAEMREITVAGEAGSGQEALALSEFVRPDVVLMDIRMPGMDGLEAAAHLSRRDSPPAIIFTTAYGDHALAAFEASAVDYLLKPVRPERLRQALDKARRLNGVQLDVVRGARASPRTHLCSRLASGIKLVPVSEIVYFRADHKYVVARTQNGEFLLDEPLKDLAREFSEAFLRVHRHTLIAKSFLEGLEKTADGTYHARLRGVDDRPEISRRLARFVKAYFEGYRAG